MKPVVCATCGKPLPVLAILHKDGYCSPGCCRKAHGCELPVHRQGSHMVATTHSTKETL